MMGSSLRPRGVKNSGSPETVVDHPIGLPVTVNAMRLAFNRAREKAGVRHFRFHDTRHGWTSGLFEAGWLLVQVMVQTGHKDPKSVKRYAYLTTEHLAEQLAKLEKPR